MSANVNANVFVCGLCSLSRKRKKENNIMLRIYVSEFCDCVNPMVVCVIKVNRDHCTCQVCIMKCIYNEPNIFDQVGMVLPTPIVLVNANGAG